MRNLKCELCGDMIGLDIGFGNANGWKTKDGKWACSEAHRNIYNTELIKNRRSDSVVQNVPIQKTSEQILAEAEADRIRHQIDLEKREAVKKSDEKFFQDMKRYWKIWVPIVALAVAFFVYKAQKQPKENQMEKDFKSLIGK